MYGNDSTVLEDLAKHMESQSLAETLAKFLFFEDSNNEEDPYLPHKIRILELLAPKLYIPETDNEVKKDQS